MPKRNNASAFEAHPETLPVSPEKIVGAHYQVLTTLGSGSMGTVYKARDRRDGSIVAVKVIEFVEDQPLLEGLFRFHQEAEISRRKNQKARPRFILPRGGKKQADRIGQRMARKGRARPR